MSERKILIVDDEAVNLRLLEVILKEAGYPLLKAITGEEAAVFVKEEQPDLIIMDVSMPGMDGIEVCRMIKEKYTDQFIPIILLTSHQDTDVEVRSFDSGADEYLIKPPKRPELLARVRAMLRMRDLHEALHKANSIIQQDVDEVGAIQRSFLPTRFPEHPQIEFGHYYHPCQSAGGDYFDLIPIDDTHWGLLIADVTGHGASAAVVMAITHTLMHSFTNTFHSPSTSLKVANEKLNEYLAPSIFVTMFYSVLHLETMSLRYSSAGHDPMFLYRGDEKRVELLKTEQGFPLKLMETDEYDEGETVLGVNDRIILFTDGMTERRNEQGDFIRDGLLQEWVLQYGHLPAQAFTDAVIEEVKAFHPDLPFQDDVTMFVIHRTA